MHDLQIALHDLVQIVGLNAAADHRAHCVAKKVQRFLVPAERGMPFEKLALVRFVQILFERRKAVLPGGIEEIVEEPQSVEIDFPGVMAALEQDLDEPDKSELFK